MDRLAAMGVSFTHAHIPGGNNGAVCMPSRAMLLTGRFFQHLPLGFTNMGRVKDNRGVSPYPTFAETFKEAGYQTFFTGKWHNGPPELFDGFTAGANIYMGGMHFLKDGGHTGPWLHDFDPTGQYPADKKWQGNKFSSELYADAAVDFIQQKSDEAPFLMYVSFTSPHDPRQAPEEFQQLYDPETITLPANFLPDHPFDNGMIKVRDEELAPHPRTPERIKEEIAGYYAMVSEVDAQIGRIIDALEAQDKLDNTIIVFAGDNGLAVGQHGLLGKQSIYDHSVRVPLIIAGPGIQAGLQSSSLCYLLDVFPTLCELTGVPAPESIEGKSLTPILAQPDTELREDVFLSFIHTQRGIRTKDNWKLIQYFVNGEQTQQLFNLNEDEWETKNLYGQPEVREKQQALEARLMQHLLDMEDPFLSPNINVEYTEFGQPPLVTINSAMSGLEVRFTVDGSDPTPDSEQYTAPFYATNVDEVKARSFYNGEPVSPIINELVPSIDLYQNVSWENEPAPQYAARGKFSLVDGVYGSTNFKDGHWLGFEKEDLVATLELKDKTIIQMVTATFIENVNDWIFPPQSITIEISANGKQFEEVFHQDLPPVTKDTGKSKRISLQHNFVDPPEVKYIRVTAKNTGVCPEWHSGSGGNAWLFVDEIRVISF